MTQSNTTPSYKDWGVYARRMISPQGAPTFALWGGLTIAQVALIVYFLGVSGQSKLSNLWVGLLNTDPKVLVATALGIIALGFLRTCMIMPMSQVLLKNRYISAFDAMVMALSKGRRVFYTTSLTTILILLVGLLATYLDVVIRTFVELPFVAMLAMAPFIAARQKGSFNAVVTSFTIGRRHWLMLFAFYCTVNLLGHLLTNVTVLETNKAIRLFFVYMAFEVIFFIASQSLFATIFAQEVDED